MARTRKKIASEARCDLKPCAYVMMAVAIGSLVISYLMLEKQMEIRENVEAQSRFKPEHVNPVRTLLLPSPGQETVEKHENSDISKGVLSNPAVVVVAHNRVEYLKRTLESLLESTAVNLFQLYVSLDSPHDFSRMEDTIYSVSKEIKVLKMRSPRIDTAFERSGIGRISRNHEFALAQSFSKGHSHVIVLEEDLLTSKDFLRFFIQTAPILDKDPSLFCVCAWNDNGHQSIAWDQRRVFRTEYFAGLGWMISKKEWDRLQGKWPNVPSTGWDHWMRLSTSNDRRECLAPEISRTKHIGEHGVNVMGGSQNSLYASWGFSNLSPGEDSLGDLSYLQKERYESKVKEIVANAYNSASSDVLVLYTAENFKTIAQKYHLWQNQPRGTHRGLILVQQRDKSYIVFADQRKAKAYLRSSDIIRPNSVGELFAGKPGQSCTTVCRAKGKRCEEKELNFANTCEALLAKFPCEAGCGHQMGLEIPSYVTDPKERTYQQCLVSDEVYPKCNAKHPITARLCICI